MSSHPVGGAPDPYRPLPVEPPVGPPVPYGTTPSAYQPPAPEPSSMMPVQPQPPVSWSRPGPYGGHPAPPYYGPQHMPYGPRPGAVNTLAILALVFGIIFPIVGIVLGHSARRQIRATGESGDGLAIAGLIIGYANSALFCAGFASLFLIGSSSGTY